MHRGDDQVSRFGSIDSELHCFGFSQFAYNDDVGIFPQHIHQSLGEGRHMSPELPLLDEGHFRLKPIFNRIVERNDMHMTGAVDMIDDRGNGCRLAHPRRSAG